MKYILSFILVTIIIFSSKNLDINIDLNKNTNQIKILEKKLDNLNIFLLKNNIWSIKYNNYELYHNLLDKSNFLKKTTNLLHKKNILSNKDKIILSKYDNDSYIIKEKLKLLKEYKDNPFQELLNPYIIKDAPEITNPFNIILGISFKRDLINIKKKFDNKFNSLTKITNSLKDKEKLLINLIYIYNKGQKKILLKRKLKKIKIKLLAYIKAFEILKISKSKLKQKIYKLNNNINYSIDRELKKLLQIGMILILFFIFISIIKFFIRKYIVINANSYILNKTLNFFFFFISIIILIFSYLENITYILTILSFISAGITFALKDIFLSIIAWFNIIIGRSIKVGDRIKVNKDGITYVGDIINISILKIILHEDVTLTTSLINRRAGRIISVPNYYIFTDMIANYSHYGLKTVWDGINISITFDSNLKKAQSIIKDIATQYSKGYTDMTRKQLNMLRSEYDLRNSSVEPRIFCSIGEYGVIISVWYLTSSYATLALQSTISIEILNALQQNDDIVIAIPSTFVKVNNQPRLIDKVI